jgi:CheY-like chemotaxis protein
MSSQPFTQPSALRVLVVDDNATWVRSLVAMFKREQISATGVSTPSDLFGWTSQANFRDFDMIFLDMRLGPTKHGGALSAADVLLHIMTYCPAAKAVIFTQSDVTVEECVRCIRLGALGFIPKVSQVEEFLLVASVYGNLGDESQAMEERISSLWTMLHGENNPAKGRHLEMLTTNLFNSIPGFRVISNNSLAFSGELDIIVENSGTHQFWTRIDSFHLILECKNRQDAAEKEVFNVISQKVAGKNACNVGIVISWSGVSSGFRQLQSAGPSSQKIFYLDRANLQELVRKDRDSRELYLRSIFENQL